MMIRNQTFIKGLTPIKLDAKTTVNGLVIALEKPNPQATIDTKNPVNES